MAIVDDIPCTSITDTTPLGAAAVPVLRDLVFWTGKAIAFDTAILDRLTLGELLDASADGPSIDLRPTPSPARRTPTVSVCC